MYDIVQRLAKKRVTPTRSMTLVLARCQHCGAITETTLQHAEKHNRGQYAHCGKCLHNDAHRMTDTRPWRIWKGLLERTTKTWAPGYKHYGGRGISVTPRWYVFKNFWQDMSSGYAEHLTIERVDVNGDYCKENCRWATNMEQQANKRNNRTVRYQGEYLHLAEFCRRAGVTRAAITRHLNAGLDGDAAVAARLACPYPKTRKSRKRVERVESKMAEEAEFISTLRRI